MKIPAPTTPHGWGYIPDIPDVRDYDHAFRTLPVTVPERPRAKFNLISPVLSQGELGSCAFNMLATLMASTMVQNDMKTWWYLSRLWAYYKYRERYGDIHKDDGAMIRLVLKLVADLGIPRESLWPYVLKNWDFKPSPEADADAPNHKVLSYHALYTKDEIKQCLAEGYCFGGGLALKESFLNVGPAGIVPMPLRREKFVGGHALTFWGYWDEKNKEEWVYGQNSWGTDWGYYGRFRAPFEWLLKYGSDFWTIRVINE